MKISTLIERLNEVMEREGDLEVTCTHSTIPDGHDRHLKEASHQAFADAIETTVENLVTTNTMPDVFGPKHVRVCL
jgi:hypothetical protein